MTRLARTMAFYAAYHQHPHNRLTHYFGVPIIVFSLILAASYARFDIAGMDVSLGMLLVAGLGLYYISLDALIGGTLLAVSIPVVWLADQVSHMDGVTAGTIGVVAFVGGWAIQLLGHKFEGNKPALTANILQIFMAPLFLMAEAFFAFGFKKNIEAEVEQLVRSGIAGPAARGHAGHHPA
jgi:uncharacterized membrane protein YGL010W